MTRKEMQILVGIITISDRASGGQYQDLGGPAVKAAAEKRGWNVLAEAIIPDDKTRIQETVRSFSAQGCGLILTTGGTGVADRDHFTIRLIVLPKIVLLRFSVDYFKEKLP